MPTRKVSYKARRDSHICEENNDDYSYTASEIFAVKDSKNTKDSNYYGLDSSESDNFSSDMLSQQASDNEQELHKKVAVATLDPISEQSLSQQE